MSKDIRSFFKPKVNTSILNSSKTSSFATPASSSKLNSKRKVIISSDEDDDLQSPSTATSTMSKEKSSPRKQQSSHPPINKKRRIIDSDDEEYNSKKTTQLANGTTAKKPNLNKLKDSQKLERKIVDVSSVFGKEPILHVARPKAVVQNQTLSENERESYFKDDFDVTDLTDTKLKDNNIISSNKQNVEGKKKIEKKQTPKKEVHTPKKGIQTPKKEIQTQKKEIKTPKKEIQTPKKEVQTQKKEIKTPKKEIQTPKKEVQTQKKEIKTPKKEIQTPKKDVQTQKKEIKTPIKEIQTPKKEVPSPKINHESQDQQSGNVSFADDARKKQIAAMLYKKYTYRSGPLHPGSKEIPDGTPNCLAGSTFVITGILESLNRNEISSIITKYGGRITTKVSKITKYVIIGEDPGPKKLATAIENGIPTLSEDDFLNLIRDKSSICNSTITTSTITPEKSPKIKAKKSQKNKAEKVKDVKDAHSDNMKKNSTVEKRKLEINRNKPNKNEIVIPEKMTKIDNNKTKLPIDKVTTTAAITDNDENNKTWVDKYKPTNTKQIIGQQGGASNCIKLTNWLTNWYSNNDGKKKLPKPTPWSKTDDGGYYKAVLLSGPPGIGKTTTATLVCQELGFDTIEFNASDTRSKKLLKDEVAKILSNKTLHGYFTGDNGGKITKKHALIMDEVDGMAGNEDRGGMQELIGLIKDTSIPIICMCNDHNHPKIRSLTNYCYDLRFSKPRLEQIKGAMLSICFKEKIKIPPKVLEEIILSTNQDVRQTINNISLIYTNKDVPPSTTETTIDNNNSNDKDAKLMKKDLRLGPWEVIRKVFSYEEHKTMSIYDKSDLFFHDYSMAPLFVQQNYLIIAPKVPKSEVLTQVALTADSISIGDLVDKRIRTNMAWSMLPTQAMFSSVLPGEYMAGHFTGQINFPAWLGKNSKTNKRNRLAQELHDHTRIRTSASRLSIRLDYATILLDKILLPLKEKGVDGVQESLDIIKEYRLLREDIDSLIEITTWSGKKNIMDSIPGKVKAALTRAYNKEVSPYTYTITTIKKKRGGGGEDDDNYDNDDYNVEDGENNNNNDGDDDDGDGNDNNIDNDVLIKSKKKTTTAQSASESSTSKKNVTSSSKNKNDKIIAKKNKGKK